MNLDYYQYTKSNLILYSSYVSALPTIYHVDENSQVAEPIMIPVASTVIPLVLFKPIIFYLASPKFQIRDSSGYPG